MELKAKKVPCLVKVPNELLHNGSSALAAWDRAYNEAAFREQQHRLEEVMRPPTPAESQARANAEG